MTDLQAESDPLCLTPRGRVNAAEKKWEAKTYEILGQFVATLLLGFRFDLLY